MKKLSLCAALAAVCVCLASCGKDDELPVSTNPLAVVISNKGKASNGMECTVNENGIYLNGVLYAIVGDHMEVRGHRTLTSGDVEIVSFIVYQGVEYKVTKIQSQAFVNTSDITSVKTGPALVEIGSSAFERCRNMKSFTFGGSIETIGEKAFYHCDALRSAELGNRVRTIADYGFGYCGSLSSVSLGQSLETIGNYAFRECSLSYLDFPATVTSIGSIAFSANPDLRIVRARMTTPPSDSGIMSEQRSQITLFVPSGTRAAYNSEISWRCASIIEE